MGEQVRRALLGVADPSMGGSYDGEETVERPILTGTGRCRPAIGMHYHGAGERCECGAQPNATESARAA